MSGRVGAIAIAVACLFCAGAAHAQQGDAALATQLFNTGRDLMKKGDYAAACPKLAESVRLNASFGALANLSQCEEHEGRLASALGYMEQAVNFARANNDKRLKDAAAELARLDKIVPKLRFQTRGSAPADLTITVDQTRVSAAGLGTPLPVDPGAHRITASAPRKKPWTTSVDTKADGATTDVQVPDLEDDKAAMAQALVADGEKKVLAQEFQAAYDLFAKAYALVPAPTTRLAMARALVQLGRLPEARDMMRSIASSPAKPDDPPSWADARKAAAVEADELDKRLAPPPAPVPPPSPAPAPTPSPPPSPSPPPPVHYEEPEYVSSEPIPEYALTGLLRPSYETWLAGTVAGASIGDVFAPAPALELDAGVRVRQFVLYGGWQRATYGVGAQSPYAQMQTVTSWGDAYFGGGRIVTSDAIVAALFDFGGGYSTLHQQATDDKGGTASVALPSVLLRLGAGLTVRIKRWIALEPLLATTFARVSTLEASAQTSGGARFTAPDSVGDSGFRVGLSIGISGTLDFALSKD